MTTEIDDLRLVWPSELFVAETSDILASGYAHEVSAVRLLFSEAFANGVGANLVREVCETMTPYRGKWQPDGPIDDPWEAASVDGYRPRQVPRSSQLIEEVFSRVKGGQIARFAPKRYWSARQQSADPPQPLEGPDLREAFVSLLQELDKAGYLDRVAGSNCCDATGDRAAEGRAAIEARWGKPAQWPLTDAGTEWLLGLGSDDFLDLIELFFDLVERPRTSSWHAFCEDWDFSDHDARAGQRVYTWRINALLERTSLSLRLSGTTEDAGCLVRTVNDERAVLPDALARATADPAERARIEHATAQQRSRHATRQTRREAVRGLADVLENRGRRVKQRLGNQDESDLFMIINRFDIRHMNKQQQVEYGDEFLDYCYWTFLASIELIDRLEARDS